MFANLLSITGTKETNSSLYLCISGHYDGEHLSLVKFVFVSYKNGHCVLECFHVYHQIEQKGLRFPINLLLLATAPLTVHIPPVPIVYIFLLWLA